MFFVRSLKGECLTFHASFTCTHIIQLTSTSLLIFWTQMCFSLTTFFILCPMEIQSRPCSLLDDQISMECGVSFPSNGVHKDCQCLLISYRIWKLSLSFQLGIQRSSPYVDLLGGWNIRMEPRVSRRFLQLLRDQDVYRIEECCYVFRIEIMIVASQTVIETRAYLLQFDLLGMGRVAVIVQVLNWCLKHKTRLK